MKISLAFLLGAVFLYGVKSFHYCDVERDININWKRIKDFKYCCDVSDDQWKLIAWYFERVGNFMDVTEIILDDGYGSNFIPEFMVDLYAHTNMKMRGFKIKYNKATMIEDVPGLYDKTYRWHPDAYKNDSSIRSTIEKKLKIRSQISTGSSTREDEPVKGVVVLATDIRKVDWFLNQETRQPFRYKSGHYIIIIYKKTNEMEWDTQASRVLTKLWKKHGIINVIILSTCLGQRVSKSYTFHNYRSFHGIKTIIFVNSDWGV